MKGKLSPEFSRFKAITQELADLRSVMGTLGWDQETMMPPKASPFRARQAGTLASLYHQKMTSGQYGEILRTLSVDEDLDEWDQAAVRVARRDHERAVRLPEELVRQLAQTTSLAYQEWVEARSRSDFAHFRPWLSKVLDLKRQQALCLSDDDGHLYDALLEEYEPGETVASLDALFRRLRPFLSTFVQRIQASPRQPNPGILRGEYPQQKQEELGRRILSAMGFDWASGRLDVSPHPFCSGISPFDVRITTRYSERDLSMGLFGIMHEGGHALYEQGLDGERFGSPACETISLGVHESQSRLWEIFVGRSRLFWKHWYPELRAAFPGQFDEVPLQDFLLAINRVRPTLIRVDADEVTYGLHVILRYEIEKDLLTNDLAVEDLEECWNSKINDYLGITPSNAAEGVLQDVHWSHGLFGYFPTYLLGTLYAAQFSHAAFSTLRGLEHQIGRGDMTALREWLRAKIHRTGKTVTAHDLVKRVCGTDPSPEPFMSYLEKKYVELYKLP